MKEVDKGSTYCIYTHLTWKNVTWNSGMQLTILGPLSGKVQTSTIRTEHYQNIQFDLKLTLVLCGEINFSWYVFLCGHLTTL
jgi:hypothetical protein